MLRSALLLSVALFTLTSAAPVDAAPTWLAPVDVSDPGQNAVSVQVAVDSQGTVIAVWQRFNGTHQIVQAAARPAGVATFGAPQNLTDIGQNASSPHVVVDDQGNATAVWRRSNGTHTIVQAATRPAGATSFGSSQDLSAPGQHAFAPQVAVDVQGNVTAVWHRFNGANTIVQTATRPAGAPAFGSPQNLSAVGEDAGYADIVVNDDGRAIVVWERSNGTHTIVQAATRLADAASFGAPQDLSVPGQNADAAQVAVDGQGNATAVWERSNGTHTIVQAASRPAGASLFDSPQDLSGIGQSAAVPQVVADAQGKVTAAWHRSDGTHDVVQSATRPMGAAAFDPPLNLSDVGQDAFSVQLAVESKGDTTAIWERFNGAEYVIQAAMRPAGAALFGAPQDLSAAGQDAGSAQLAVGAQGDPTTVWARSNGSNYIVQAVVLDATGPLLREVHIPATGVTGQSLDFSVAPADRWSAVGSTVWQFGDGATAATSSASHRYDAPGTYTVVVTSSDSAGNATSATGTVAVAAAADEQVVTIDATDTTGPILGVLRLAPRQFRAVGKGAGIAAKRRSAGTTLRFTASEKASFRGRISRLSTGRRSANGCAPATSRNRRARRCTRTTRLRGTLVVSARSGANSRRLTGRLGRKKLRPGRYRLTATLTDADKNISKARTASFTITR